MTFFIFCSSATYFEYISVLTLTIVNKDLAISFLSVVYLTSLPPCSLPKLEASISAGRPSWSYWPPYMSPTFISTLPESPCMAPFNADVGSLLKRLRALKTPRNMCIPIVDPHILECYSFESTLMKLQPLLRFTSKYGYKSCFKLKYYFTAWSSLLNFPVKLILFMDF